MIIVHIKSTGVTFLASQDRFEICTEVAMNFLLAYGISHNEENQGSDKLLYPWRDNAIHRTLPKIVPRAIFSLNQEQALEEKSLRSG